MLPFLEIEVYPENNIVAFSTLKAHWIGIFIPDNEMMKLFEERMTYHFESLKRTDEELVQIE